ncbi:MAG: hypothetical protein C4345_14680, partial [Chloroflexota bacterium]
MVGDRLVGVGSFRLRLGTAISYCIGAEGPVRTTLDRLRQVGVGERVIKSAIAGGLAWEIAQVLPG